MAASAAQFIFFFVSASITALLAMMMQDSLAYSAGTARTANAGSFHPHTSVLTAAAFSLYFVESAWADAEEQIFAIRLSNKQMRRDSFMVWCIGVSLFSGEGYLLQIGLF